VNVDPLVLWIHSVRFFLSIELFFFPYDLSTFFFSVISVNVCIRDDHFLFGLIFIKKITKPNFFLKKLKPVQTGRFRFSSVVLGQKPVQTGFTWFWPGFFRFDLVFFWFFFWFGFDSIFLILDLYGWTCCKIVEGIKKICHLTRNCCCAILFGFLFFERSKLNGL